MSQRYKLNVDGKYQGGSFTEPAAKAIAKKLEASGRKVEVIAKKPPPVDAPKRDDKPEPKK